MEVNDTGEKVHMGRNIKRFREMFGIKQEALAADLGDEWNQKKISLLEQKETIDNALLEQVAKALRLPVDAIKNFDEEKAINIISNTFNDHATNMNYQCIFNPLDKYIEQVEENKKLYVQLLQAEKEKNALLQKIIDSKK